MKKIFICVSIILLSTTFFSCSKNEIKPEPEITIESVPYSGAVDDKTSLYKLIIETNRLKISKAKAPEDFRNNFTEKALRIDYSHRGNSSFDSIFVNTLIKYPFWAGNPMHLTDEFNNGRYYAKIYDFVSGILLYSKGFDNYFFEYQTGEEAIKGEIKEYMESLIIPCPKKSFIFSIEKRNKNNALEEIFREEVDPNTDDIPEVKFDETINLYLFGNPDDTWKKVDLAVIGEGYSKNDSAKFFKDLQRVKKSFFSIEPYKSNEEKFNLWGVLKYSEDSGVDEPRAGIDKNTAVNATFNSLGSERYLLTEDHAALRDIAGNVPYDAILVMVNSPRYGGGGIYNFYCAFTSDNQFFEYLLLHEFGHSFSGLADEYYTSDVAYSEFYAQGVEPNEPNITALLDPANVKWKELLTPGIETPTVWEKDHFDKTSLAWIDVRKRLNDKVAELKKNGANQKLIKQAEENYAKQDKAQSDKIHKILAGSKYAGQVGVFEGAGYASKGLYRSMIDCIMFSKGKKPYCRVCEKAVERIIKAYCE